MLQASSFDKAGGGCGKRPEARNLGTDLYTTADDAGFEAVSIGGSNLPVIFEGSKTGGGCGALPDFVTFFVTSFFSGGWNVPAGGFAASKAVGGRGRSPDARTKGMTRSLAGCLRAAWMCVSVQPHATPGHAGYRLRRGSYNSPL